jgi:ribonuclease P protein component
VPDGVWRIGDRATFEALRRSSARARGRLLSIVHVPAGAGEHRVRVAYAVGRPVGSAVERNRARRRLRAVVAELAHSGRLPAGSYLVSARPGINAMRFGDLLATVSDLAGRVTCPKAPTP